MVFVGGWSSRPRRRGPWGGPPPGYGGYGGPPGYGYGGPGYGRGRGGCLRDALLLETGCCLADALTGNCLVGLLGSAGALAATTHGRHRPPGRHRGPGRPRGAGAQGVLLEAVRRYRRDVSPRRGHPVCRFEPSCSAYAEEALQRHGARRGTALAAARLLRCRPGALGGRDPVPA